MKQFVATLLAWGPFGVMLLAAIDSAGVPLPGGVDTLIVLVAIHRPAAGYLAAGLAVISSCVGCMFLFWLARKGGEHYLDKHASSPRAMRFRRWFDQYGLLTVFIPTLVVIPLPVKVFVLSAGALGTRPLAFLGVVLAARIPRYFGLAWLGTRAVVARLGDALPRSAEIGLDGRVLGFALLACLLSGLLAAIAPAARASAVSLRALIGTDRTAVRGGRNLPGAALVGAEVALALLLLTGGGLLVRSFLSVLGQDLGYDPEHVVVAGITLSSPAYRDDPARRLVFIVSHTRLDLYEKLRQALIREPDVDLILDRRSADRRLADSPIERERRGRQRRQRLAVDAEVRTCGWTVVKLVLAPGERR